MFGKQDVVCLILNGTERSVSYLVNGSELRQMFENIDITNDYKFAACMAYKTRLLIQASTHLKAKVL